MTHPLPYIALTLGDPAGVGPHVSALAALAPGVRKCCRPLLVGDARVVQKFFQHRGAKIHLIADPSRYANQQGVLNVWHVPHPETQSLKLGLPQRIGGQSAVLSLRAAVFLALQKRVAAIVTGPVSKESLRLAEVPQAGHTEMLKKLCNAPNVEMLMAAKGNGLSLMALLLTRHVPYKDVPRLLTIDRFMRALRTATPLIKRCQAIARRPRWALCGLNPHAGDNGLLGREEITVIKPAAARLRAAGFNVTGPLSADAAWAKHAQGHFDAVACLTHDQAMVPLKALFPNKVVNITAGLPLTRVSPGHGTAFDLARGRKPFSAADPTATIEAVFCALRLAFG